ncbi:MAG TPA: hypothetical protein VK158_03120 [Acidobacteriota bacterium]|nr:hypothetical protein [Acidobacteriota bacterium]
MTQLKVPLRYTKEAYIRSFGSRYRGDVQFREKVHEYLNLSRTEKFKLSVGKRIFTGWYERKTNDLISQYATHVYEKRLQALEITQGLSSIGSKAQSIVGTKNEIDAKKTAAQTLEQTVTQVQQSESQAVQDVAATYEAKTQEELAAIEQKKQEIQNADVTRIAQEKIREHLVDTGVFSKDRYGSLTFNDDKLVSRLQDSLLDETLKGLSVAGKSGIKEKAIAAFNGIFDRYTHMEDMSELPNVDWFATNVNMKIAGRSRPIIEDFVVAKYKTPTYRELGLDTAITVDYSGSMDYRATDTKTRWDIAQQMGGAAAAMMRQLSSKNKVSLSVFNHNRVTSLTHAEYLKLSTPNEGTPMHLGLKWLRETLTDRRLSMAYLVSDGAPDSLSDAVQEAEYFASMPNVLLRIFLVDGDGQAKENVKAIGKAAGPKTRVMLIDSKKLAGNMILDLTKTLGELKSIDSL